MENQFQIGSINYTEWEYNINVRYVAIAHIGEDEPLKNILLSGGIVLA